MKLTLCVLVICALFKMQQTEELSHGSLLEGINDVAVGATNFLSRAINGPRKLVNRVKDRAVDLVGRAVDIPRRLIEKTTTGASDFRNFRLIDKRIVHSTTSKVLESKLRFILESFRIRMREGIPDVGIPTLDPLFISHYDMNTHNEKIGDVSGFIHNVTVWGASTFVVDRAELSLIQQTMTLNLTVPTLYATGYYKIDGRIGNMFNIYGNGTFTATIYNTKVYVDTVLEYSRGFYMKSFDLDFSIKSINTDLCNLMRNEKYGRVINQVFQEVTPEALEIIKPEILPEIQDYISNRANDTLYNLTLGDVINLLNYKIDIGDFLHIFVGKKKTG